MKQEAPPLWLEALAALLTPPRVREDVLGDLHELYRNSSQYFVEVLGAIPRVVLSEIRRTRAACLFPCDAVIVLAAMGHGREAVGLEWALPPWMVAITLIVPTLLVLRRAYRTPSTRFTCFVEPAVALVTAMIATATIRPLWPQGSVSFGALALGGTFAYVAMVMMLSFLESGRGTFAADGPKLERAVPALGDPAIGLFFGPMLLTNEACQSIAAGHVWSGLATLVVTCGISWRVYAVRVSAQLAGPARLESLQNRRAAFARLWSWYLGPLLGASILLYISSSGSFGGEATWSRFDTLIALAAGIAVGLVLLHARGTAKEAVERLSDEIDRSSWKQA